jgi:hypothetical protein
LATTFTQVCTAALADKTYYVSLERFMHSWFLSKRDNLNEKLAK